MDAVHIDVNVQIFWVFNHGHVKSNRSVVWDIQCGSQFTATKDVVQK